RGRERTLLASQRENPERGLGFFSNDLSGHAVRPAKPRHRRKNRLQNFQYLHPAGGSVGGRLLRHSRAAGEITRRSSRFKCPGVCPRDDQRNRDIQNLGSKLWLRLLCSPTRILSFDEGIGQQTRLPRTSHRDLAHSVSGQSKGMVFENPRDRSVL